MRLKAKVGLTYAGREFQPGALFDALERDGREMIGRDEAEPFNLEDPASRSLSSILEDMRPEEPPALPDVPPVTISPTSDDMGAGAGAGAFDVTMTGEGLSGTWTVTKDASATWLTYTPMTPQSTDGTVSYNVTANTGAERVAHLYTNGKTFTITQAAGAARRSR